MVSSHFKQAFKIDLNSLEVTSISMQKEEIPSIHQEHQVDRNLVEHALDLLEASRTPRDEPVPLIEGLELPEVMPESGIEAKKMLDELASSVLETSAQLHHPGFMAHMLSLIHI